VNESSEPARFLIIGTLPQGMRGMLRSPSPVARARQAAEDVDRGA
jgi:hypothetical protein